MFGISWAEFLVVALVAIVVLGPGKLPEAARAAGQVYGRLNRFLAEARSALKTEFDLAELTRPRPPSPSPPAVPAAESAPPPVSDQRPRA